jgi:hypothetical protein
MPELTCDGCNDKMDPHTTEFTGHWSGGDSLGIYARCDSCGGETLLGFFDLDLIDRPCNPTP